jgi:hypothetical protein
MTDRTLRLFSTIIVALTAGILLGALALQLPADWATIALAAILRPEGLRLAALSAIGLVALIEVLVLLPSSPPAANVELHTMFFPGMPLAVGVAGIAEE